MNHLKGFAIRYLLLGVVATFVGCQTAPDPDAGKREVSPRLAKAEELFQKGDNSGAMIACVDLAREDPALPGLQALQRRIMARLSDQRAEHAAQRKLETRDRMITDVQAHNTVPDTYSLRRNIRGTTGSLRKPPSPMQKVLEKKVDASFDNINLGDFIREAGIAYGLNMVADSAVGQDKTINLNFKQVPLSEVLDYVSRNFNVSIYLGENVIWVSAGAQNTPGLPMETRMYRIRKGISPDSVPSLPAGGASGAAPNTAADTGSQPLNIMEALQRFVPQPEGADLMFDRKSHTLMVKNTAENLVKVEDIVEAMDICPPQVLIEARFIKTTVTDLRELGVDWTLNSPMQVSTANGANETEVNQGATLRGLTPLTGATSGLNLTYAGLLTDPMFTALLHALETSGKAQTLSVPRVTTVNNRAAVIRIGTDFRYFEEFQVQSSGATTTTDERGVQSTTQNSRLVPVGTPKLEELGIELNVTPSVGADMQSVTLNLHPEISSFDRYETYDVAVGDNNSGTSATTNPGVLRLPIFRRSKIETQVVVQSGETVVMGGLMSSTEEHTRSGIPWLLNIPLIGQFFRHDTIKRVPDNLLIFVTATIISERGENLIPLADGPQALPAGATDARK